MAFDSTTIATILALEKTTRAVSNATNKATAVANDSTTDRCMLLELPAEIRNRIWVLTVQGDGGAIHVDHMMVWLDVEWIARLNITRANKQICDETAGLFHPNNTFLFQTDDRARDYGVLENMAEWMAFQAEEDRDNIGKVVVCSAQTEPMVKWAWQNAQWCDMDFGFVLGKRIDRLVHKEYRGMTLVETYDAWGKEDGHFCTHGHWELVKKGAKKGSKK